MHEPRRARPESPLRLLHICSDYAKQRVYRELVTQLDALGVRQFIYVPVRSTAELDANRNDDLRQGDYRFSHVLKPRHRLFFRAKVRAVLRDLLSYVAPGDLDLTHAHFLYSDGAVALKIEERYGVPYVVTVRNTDVNVFMRYRPDLIKLCWKIVAHARHVVFIAPAYRELLIARAPSALREDLRRKARIVPNGVGDFWLGQGADREPVTREADTLRLLYVGDFSRNDSCRGPPQRSLGDDSHAGGRRWRR
jgi:hypothetical protein